MAADVANGLTPILPDIKSTLEQRYITLLEKRIADLERVINTEKPVQPELSNVLQTPMNVTVKIGSNDKPEDPKTENALETSSEVKSDDKGSELAKKSRVKNVISAWNQDAGIREDREVGNSSSLSDTVETGESSGVAFTIRRVMSIRDITKLAYTEVDIQAQGLRIFLKNMIGQDYPSQSWEGQTINMAAPFPPIVFNWDKLMEETIVQDSDDTKLKETREDLAQLLNHLRRADELTGYFKTRDSNRTAKVTTYETMWTIFAPETEVIAKPFLNSVQAFKVEIPPEAGPGNNKTVYCWGYDWNGKDLVKVWYEFPIDKFKGTKEIDTLDCYPFEFHQDEIADSKDATMEATSKALRQRLIERGTIFNTLCRVQKGAKQMFDYDDLVLWSRLGRGAITRTNKSDDDNQTGTFGDDNNNQDTTTTDNSVPKPFKVTGRIIVDAAAFRQFGPGTLPLGDMLPEDIEDLSEKTAEIIDVQEEAKYLLCPPRVVGYATKEKMWGQFRVESVKPITENPDATAFDRDLQLDGRYKIMVKALVANHSGGNSKGKADVVKGKGQGLVLLLHGPPGVGKTLTAETIAEATGKPLLVVSVAEIGLVASNAERNLDRMFALAGAWEAILLVDEADVFLETRNRNGDPNRNALISVLLRVLEYYQGIMILTTNRINSLDIAVQSRIHLAIRYDDLKQKDKISIFNYFLDALEYDNVAEREKIKDWIAETGSDYQLNGRQIRNVVSTAHALASSEGNGRSITRDHFKKVTALTKEFQAQLEKLTMAQRGDNEASGK